MTDDPSNDASKALPALRQAATDSLVRRGVELAAALQRAAAQQEADHVAERSILALKCIDEARSYWLEARTQFWDDPDPRRGADAICRGFLWLIVAGIDILEVTSPPLTLEQTTEWIEAALDADSGGLDQIFSIAQSTASTLLETNRLQTDVGPFARELREIMVAQVESECSISDEMLDSLATLWARIA